MATLAAAAVMWYFNVWPGRLPEASTFYIFGGTAQCVADEFPNLDFRCEANGLPAGLIPAFGYPQVWAQGALVWLGLDPINALRLVMGTTLLVALAGATAVFRRLTAAPRWLATVFAGLFLLSPIVSGQAGYGPLQLGFALVPTYVLIDMWLLDALDARRWRVAAFAVVLAARTYAMFTDGYSFVMSMCIIVPTYAIWAWQRRHASWRLPAIAATALAASSAAAFALYSAYLGVSSFEPMSTEFFRGQGVDFFALLAPDRFLWLWGELGIHHTITASQAYSDSLNITDVFIGWALLATAIAGATIALRRRRQRMSLAPFALAAIVGFVLAIGPSFKFADFRPPVALDRGIPGLSDYEMPAADATAPTGLAWIYHHVPGINTMRALYRWELLVRLGLLVFACGFVAWALRTRRVALAALALVAIALETPRSATEVSRLGRLDLAAVDGFTADVVDPLRGLFREGERITLVNAAGLSGDNFYLANWICPELDVRCTNVGGDKSGAFAAAQQSSNVLNMHYARTDVAEHVSAALTAGDVDAVVLVRFDMRADAYAWPPPSGLREQAAAAEQPLIDDPRFDAESTEWATVLRLADDNAADRSTETRPIGQPTVCSQMLPPP